jgi:hypothetical protein
MWVIKAWRKTRAGRMPEDRPLLAWRKTEKEARICAQECRATKRYRKVVVEHENDEPQPSL